MVLQQLLLLVVLVLVLLEQALKVVRMRPMIDVGWIPSIGYDGRRVQEEFVCCLYWTFLFPFLFYFSCCQESVMQMKIQMDLWLRLDEWGSEDGCWWVWR